MANTNVILADQHGLSKSVTVASFLHGLKYGVKLAG